MNNNPADTNHPDSKNPADRSDRLRRQAEVKLKKLGLKSGIHQDKDIQELIHELSIHQIELEMQNEELRIAQSDTLEALAKYSDLYDFAPLGYFTIDKKGLIAGVNLTGARLLGVERTELVGNLFSRFVASDDQDTFWLHCRQAIKTRTLQHCEIKLARKDESQIHVELQSIPVPDNAGDESQLRTAVSEITDRKQAEAALRSNEEKFRLLFNEMLSGFALREVIVDNKGKPVDLRILDANPAYERITGLKKSQILGKTVLEIMPETESYWIKNFGNVALTGIPVQFENYHHGLDKHFFVSAFSPQKNQVAISIIDITDRKNYEQELQKAHDKLEEQVALRTAELVKSNLSLKQEIVDRKRAEDALAAERQRLFSVLNELPVFIYLLEPDYSIRFANRYFRDRFGSYENKKCYELTRGSTAVCMDCLAFSVFESGQPQGWESSTLRDGRIYQIFDYPFTDFDGAQLVLEIGIDITKRKRAESEIRRLSSLLLNAQEDERRRIAFELHDDLGQDLNVLKLQIGSIKRKIRKDHSSLQQKCEIVLLELNKTIEKVRRISHALSPSILVELGLSAALRWLINNFKVHSSIKTSISIPDTINVFSTQQQIVIFRIFQEILTNIGKHAGANRVSVNCKRKTDKVFFKVEDDGIGFDIEHITANSATEKGLGLVGMDERVKMLDGQLEILSRGGEGTRIIFEIPIGKSGLTDNNALKG